MPPEMFVVWITPRPLSGGETLGGALQIKLEDGPAIVGFSTWQLASKCVSGFSLSPDSRIIPVSELQPSDFGGCKKVLLFTSEELFLQQRQNPNAFPYRQHVVVLS